jgi:hypothetical protein
VENRELARVLASENRAEISANGWRQRHIDAADDSL